MSVLTHLFTSPTSRRYPQHFLYKRKKENTLQAYTCKITDLSWSISWFVLTSADNKKLPLCGYFWTRIRVTESFLAEYRNTANRILKYVWSCFFQSQNYRVQNNLYHGVYGNTYIGDTSRQKSALFIKYSIHPPEHGLLDKWLTVKLLEKLEMRFFKKKSVGL